METTAQPYCLPFGRIRKGGPHRGLALSPYLFLVFGFCCLILPPTAQAATYYIDYAGGSDSYDGMEKYHTVGNTGPWRRQPYMNGFTGAYTHQAGDRFIFKGGVTWDKTCWTMVIPASTGGTAANNDYYGVDLTWFTGTSFTRPIFDAQRMKLWKCARPTSRWTISNLPD